MQVCDQPSTAAVNVTLLAFAAAVAPLLLGAQRLAPAAVDREISCPPDMELGHWVTGSMGHLGRLSRPGHWVIILTRCGTRVFLQVFEKNAQNAKRTYEMLK